MENENGNLGIKVNYIWFHGAYIGVYRVQDLGMWKEIFEGLWAFSALRCQSYQILCSRF